MLLFSRVIGQDSLSYFEKHTKINGYVKFMQTLSGDVEGNIYDQSLWHNRINTTFFNTGKDGGTTLYFELRNRIFYGEAVRLNPDMSTLLDLDGGIVDLSYVTGEANSFLYSTIIDRFWYKGYYKKWEWSIGRQRINWGINTYWNANDIFNAFTFTDFDYEERPGSDAVSIQKYFNNGSDVEVALSINRDTAFVAATKYSWNYWNYDFQILGGVYFDDVVLGGGWAGGIKNWGFKGEISYFHNPIQKQSSGTSLSISGEYLLKNNHFIGLGGLYSSNGVSKGMDVSSSLLAFQTSAKSLMPTRWSTMTSIGGEINGLTNYTCIIVYMPGVNYVLLMPSITRSVAQNLDWSIHMINLGGVLNEDLLLSVNGFMRLKWSF